MSMPRNKRKLLRSVLTANGGCGNCGKPKAFDVHNPTPKRKISSHPDPNPTVIASPSSIPYEGGGEYRQVTSAATSGKLSRSIVVEMNSEDPYNDFKQSIVQMIIERELYSTAELGELLQCFLKLNLPCHRELILKAFSDICQVDSPAPRVNQDQAP